MRELVRTMADALEQRGLSRDRALEVAANGLTLMIEAVNEECRRQGETGECLGYAALEHVEHAITTAEEREAWAAAEIALDRGDPVPLFSRQQQRGAAARARWGL